MLALHVPSNLTDRIASRGGAPVGQPDLVLPGQGRQRLGRDHLRVAAAARDTVPGATIAPVSRPASRVAAVAARPTPASPWFTGLEALVTTARAAVAAWTASQPPAWPGTPAAPAAPPLLPAAPPAVAPAGLAPVGPAQPAPAATAGPFLPALPAVPLAPFLPALPAVPPAPAPAPAFPAPFPATVQPSSFPGQGPRVASAQPPLHDPAYRAALDALRQLHEQHHSPPAADPTRPPAPLAPPPAAPPPLAPPPPPVPPMPPGAPGPLTGDAAGRLRQMSAEELAQLGRTDKRAFLEALRPAAEDSERRYGVPAAVTMAQAALETGWGKAIIPGFNIFGIKGKGPAGTISQGTWEVYNGRRVDITANFARYNDFHEAVMLHGKLFHNGYYDKAVQQFQQDRDPHAFARNITGTYATDPSYGRKLSEIMRTYGLA